MRIEGKPNLDESWTQFAAVYFLEIGASKYTRDVAGFPQHCTTAAMLPQLIGA
jgi:hypothetical protein